MAKNKNFLLRIFPAMEVKNYRYYFVGQLISQIGTWLQIVAQGWLVLQLTKSPFLIGLVAAAATLPSLLFSLFGGVLVDRFDKKKLIIITQASSMVLATILGAMTILGTINVWQIIVLSFLLGVVNAVDMPARQAFVSEMVEKDKVPSAVALNAGIFNAARVVGPSVAGILIALVGVGGAFLLNAASYIAAIIVQFLIVPIVHKKPKHSHPIKAIKEGLSYTWTHPVIKALIMLTAIVSIFGWSYTTLIPYMAETIFHQGAAGLGYLYAAAGLGALLAALLVSALAHKFSPNLFIIGGNIIFAVSLIAFSFVSNLYLAYFFLFLEGFGLLCAFAVINAQLQHLVEPHFKGRVLSVYLLTFVGFFPIGNFQIGLLSEHLGPQMAIRIGAVIVLLAAIVFFFAKGRVTRAHEEYISDKIIDSATIDVSVRR